MTALRKTLSLAAAATLVAVGLSACSTSPFETATPIFKINGSCTTKSGTLRGVGSGFSQSATYQTIVTKPDGSAYDTTQYSQFGNTSETGTIDNWTWPCKGDPSGVYTVAIKDLKSNTTVKMKFAIG